MPINPLEELSLGERLRIVRVRRRLSQEEAAHAAREWLPGWVPMSREIVRRFEAGMISEQSANPLQLVALSAVYGVDPEWLLATTSDEDGKRFSKLVEVGGRALSRCTGPSLQAA